ncbi:MAG: hypothetical protein UR68_C0046G0002 [Candidatus Roizmanbacteria bacterium GW2011_GWA2_35_19]|uniref:Uncharacterized protein n=1 Tax=Candidatus Roizmanbacteria bacterium GW2011_GWA2_35_19 TaxID=1618478 RepID=A0A0G0BKN8_9BACT|nr:MAG: hypothetical protein UR68_C0046G0002 [Candidatus Roizmanbacteria bacterium GW2011_GWA2_35_19]
MVGGTTVGAVVTVGGIGVFDGAGVDVENNLKTPGSILKSGAVVGVGVAVGKVKSGIAIVGKLHQSASTSSFTSKKEKKIKKAINIFFINTNDTPLFIFVNHIFICYVN